MKPKKHKTGKAPLPKGFKVDPSLQDKHNDQPLFKEKISRANHLLKTVGLPRVDKIK